MIRFLWRTLVGLTIVLTLALLIPPFGAVLVLLVIVAKSVVASLDWDRILVVTIMLTVMTVASAVWSLRNEIAFTLGYLVGKASSPPRPLPRPRAWRSPMREARAARRATMRLPR